MVYTEIAQSWDTPSTPKCTNRVSLIPFVGNPHFSILVHRVWYLKIDLCIKNIMSSFSRGSLRSKTKDARASITSCSFLLAKDIFLRNQKFDFKQLKVNTFIFDVNQLKMNKFISSIWQLIISISNATLEVLSLRPNWDQYETFRLIWQLTYRFKVLWE